MKYLENYPELEHLSRALTFDTPECRVFARFEAYSCKAVSKEKKLHKQLDQSYAQDILNAAHSPTDMLESILDSPFGSMDEPSSRKVMFMLISTLNVAFPDHDFSSAHPDQFTKEPSPSAIFNSLSSTLLDMRSSSDSPRSFVSHLASSEPNSFLSDSSMNPLALSTTHLTHPALQRMLDNVINIDECDVYTYSPDINSNPYAAVMEDENEYDSDDYDMLEEHVHTQSNRMSNLRNRMRSDIDDPFSFAFDEDISTPSTPLHDDSYSSHFLTRSSYGDDSDGLLWSRFIFAYNKKAKRILFVSIWGRKSGIYHPTAIPIAVTDPFASLVAVTPSASTRRIPIHKTSNKSRRTRSSSIPRRNSSTKATVMKRGKN